MKFFKFALVIFIFFSIERFCHSQTKGFSVSRVLSQLQYNPNWEANPLPLEQDAQLQSALDQTFTFSGSGGSFYTFASADGNYVIKLFKMHHLNPLPWLQDHPMIPFFSFFNDQIARKQRKLHRVFKSCKLACEELKEETGMVYIHLNKTKTLHKKTLFIDKLGIAHHLDLDNLEFVVQKRADLACSVLNSLMNRGEKEKAKQAVAAIVELMRAIPRKGFHDHDMNVVTNFGFIQGRPVQFDIGPFRKDERMLSADFCRKKLKRPLKKFEGWIKQNQPELLDHFKLITMDSRA